MPLSFVSTLKQLLTLPYVFGNTGHACTRKQNVIPETGLLSVLPEVKKVCSNLYFQFTGLRSGTGHTTFLQLNDDNLQLETFEFSPKSQYKIA